MWLRTVKFFIFINAIKVLHAVNCGQPKIQPNTNIHFKITGGQEAIPFSWPWQTYIKYIYSNSAHGSCAGTLINNKWVLTVAHCFFYGDVISLVVKLGIFDKTKCPTGSRHYHVYKRKFNSSVFIHPDYIHGTIESPNDIALIKLPESIKYNYHISPVCLPRNDSTINVIHKHLTITGWGKTNATSSTTRKLRQAVVWIHPADVPNVFGCSYIKKFDKEKQICAGIRAYGGRPRRGACVGDSGGPLVRLNRTSNKWFQYGVISGGHKPCGEDNLEADEFTRVAYYCDWIEQVIGESICLPEKNAESKRD